MKKHMLIIPLLSFAFIACEKESELRPGSSVKIEPTDHAAKERDKLQMQMIKKAIDDTPLLANEKNIEMEVKNSSVHIGGTVHSPEAKEVLERVIKSVQGIKSVDSAVTVDGK